MEKRIKCASLHSPGIDAIIPQPGMINIKSGPCRGLGQRAVSYPMTKKAKAWKLLHTGVVVLLRREVGPVDRGLGRGSRFNEATGHFSLGSKGWACVLGEGQPRRLFLCVSRARIPSPALWLV